jgi:beta-lactamase class A
MRRESSGGPGWILLFLLLTLFVLGGAWFYTTWQSSQNVLPAGLMINEQPMGGMTREQALNAIEQVYTSPISVTYAGISVPPLLPEMIELHVDMEATQENLDSVLIQEATAEAFLQDILNRLLQREPQTYDVKAVVLYSRDRVNRYLERTARKYDHPPQEPVALPEAGTFRPARDGTTLDVEASLPILIDAILAADPTQRQVDLIVEIEPAPAASTDLLKQALTQSLEGFNGIAGIFAKDLRTGQEMCLNCKVAFAGLSTLKLGIGLDYYHVYESPLNAEQSALINAMMTQSDNAAANQVLAAIHAGSPLSGALHVTGFLNSLGFDNTFLAAPYDLKEGIDPPGFVTPANSRTDLNTEPDAYLQTTPLEMGLLMESIYQCVQGGGMLRIQYPRELPPSECQELLTWAERNEIRSLLGEGMPEGTRIAHKHGWRGDTHGDVSLIYGPKSDFVVAAFVYQPDWLAWEDSVPTFATIGSLTYRFFNGETGLP